MSVADELGAIVAKVSDSVRRAETATHVAQLLAREVQTRADLVRVALTRSEAEDVRTTAVWALDRLEDRAALAQLLPLIGDASEPAGLRGAVTQALAHWEEAHVVALLRETLAADTDAEVRCSAAWALGFRAPGAFVGDLVAVLEDAAEDPRVRGYAAEAIGHLFEKRRVPPEARRAVRASVLEPDPRLRWDAVFALGSVGTVQDIALLERVLAAERARESPDALVVSETEDSIRRLSARRRSRRT